MGRLEGDEMSSLNHMGSMKSVGRKSSSTYLELEVVRRVDQVSGRVLVCRHVLVK
jgi:hypothetical protein